MDNLPYKDRRIVEGFGSVEIKDNAGEIIPISEIQKYMEVYEKRGAPIMYGHKNQPVGKMIDWEVVNKEGRSAIKLRAKIFNDYKEDDEVWEKIKKGIITGFSLGGGRPVRKVTNEGTYLYDVPVWEYSLVERPCNKESVLTGISVAKSDESLDIPFLEKGCEVKKPEGVNEADWEKAKSIVDDEYKDVPKESDRYYALVQSIYQNMTNKEDTQSIIEDKEVEQMVEIKKEEPMPEESKPTIEERIAYIEKVLGEVMQKLTATDEATEKEEPKEEEKPKEEPKEEEKKPEVDYEEIKKFVVDEVKKALSEVKKEEPKEVKKSEPVENLPVKKSEVRKDEFKENYFK